MSSDRSVMFGYIHGGTVRAEFMESVTALLAGPESRIIGSVTGTTAGPLIAMARNLMVQKFLASDMEWLWQVDTDIVFRPDTLKRLLEVGTPAISGLYYIVRDGKRTPSAFMFGEKWEFPAIEKWGPGEIVKVEATGAGCLLVHRDVFGKIRDDNYGGACWFREMVIDGRDVGEDLSFGVRVAETGTPLYVHTGINVGHIKPAFLGEVT